MARAWALITMGGEQQYAGNRGYEDAVKSIYRYDSHVGNYLNVEKGDLAILRDESHILGIARIEFISSGPGKKVMRRCPVCRITGLKTRARLRPKYRCNNKHAFETPIEELVDVTVFEAHYANTFEDAPDAVPVESLKAASPRPSDQLSIQEIDVIKLEHALLSAYPATHRLLSAFYQAESLDGEDADDTADDGKAVSHEPQVDTYSSSIGDERKRVLRAIKQRRGQGKFRSELRKRYGDKCMVTGCAALDVLEAAHIWPYRGDTDNHAENGLLLRADIHTLFDLDLIAVHPETLSIHVAPNLRTESAYSGLEGCKLGVTNVARPSREPLQRRWDAFIEKWRSSPR
jgi:putative restriction endonuclease